MAIHTVKSGESLSLIAKNYGFASWKELYHAPSNAAFRARRPNPDLIHPGDTIDIPKRNGMKPLVPMPRVEGKEAEIVSMTVDGTLYTGTRSQLDEVVDVVIDRIVKEMMPSAKRALLLVRLEYEQIDALVKSDPFVAHTLDFFTRGDLTPSSDALTAAEQAFKEVEFAIAGRFIPKIRNEFLKAERSANQAIKVYQTARNKLTRSAEISVPVLEYTSDISFAILAVAGTIYSGGATSGILATKAGALGFDALISTVKAGANETGKYIAGSRSQNGFTAAANIGTAFVSSVVLGKIFSNPKLKEVFGTLAYRMAPKLNPSKMGIRIVKTGAIKQHLESYLTTLGKEPLQIAWTEATKSATGEQTFEQMAEKVLTSPVSATGKTLQDGFILWLLEKGIAKKIITK